MRKRWKTWVLVAICGVIAGCATFHKSQEGAIVTDEVFQTLTADQQAEYPIEFKAVSTPVSESVSETLASGEVIAGRFGPVGEAVGGLIAVLGIAWAGITKVQLRKGREKTDALAAGARITADNIEEVLAKSATLWKLFKQKQRDAKTKMAAEDGITPVMPDKVLLASKMGTDCKVF